MDKVAHMERDKITTIVARNIDSIMKSKGLDAAKLSRMAGMNPTGIYDILSGKSRSPKIETIYKIAQALNVPVATIFSDLSDDDMRQDILYIFETLSPVERERLLQTGRAWLPNDEPE